MTMSRLSPTKFGDNFLKERDLFELMRSRKVYQVQFELMRNYRKQIRAIEIAEKSYFSGYENRRVLFLQRMAEQVKQRNRIKIDSGTEGKDTREIHRKVSKFYHATNLETLAENLNCSQREENVGLEHFIDTKCERISKNIKMDMKLDSNSGEFDSALLSPEFYNDAKTMILPGDVKTIMEDKTKERYVDVKEMSDYKFETQLAKHMPKIEMKGLSEKTKSVKRLNSKKTSISLPELNIMTKPMVSMEIGGVTPDGRLILTKEDYDEYLYRFRRARDARLDRVRRKSQTLEQLVASFHVQDDAPEIRFKTETRMSSDSVK